MTFREFAAGLLLIAIAIAYRAWTRVRKGKR